MYHALQPQQLLRHGGWQFAQAPKERSKNIRWFEEQMATEVAIFYEIEEIRLCGGAPDPNQPVPILEAQMKQARVLHCR